MKIIYTTPFWYGVGHHASFSGYHQLVKHVKVPNLVVYSSQQKAINRSIAVRLARRFLLKASDLAKAVRSMPKFYSEMSVKIELTALASTGDVVHHLYGEDTLLLSFLLKKVFSKVILATFHQPPSVFEYCMPFRWKKLLGSIDSVIVLSTAQQIFLTKVLNGNPPVSYIPHGVEFNGFNPSSHERRNCLMVGQWLRDFDVALKAMKETERRGVKIIFDVVLPSATPKDVITKMKNVSLSNTHIHYDISEETLLELYSKSRMFLMPSMDFAASNSLLEAMASGLPIIITDIGGASDYVNEKCGIFVRKSDSNAIVEAITYLLEDEDACKTMGREAREKASFFSWSVIAHQYEKMYIQSTRRC